MKSLKLLCIILFLPLSLKAQIVEDKLCASRYIYAAEDLVDISLEYNQQNISKLELATYVNAVAAEVVALRVACFNESEKSKKCVKNTKEVYKKIRRKINLNRVLTVKGHEKIKVSEVQLLGLLKGVFSCPTYDRD